MKREVIRNRKYLDWLRTQRCVLTGLYADDFDAVEPAHIGTLGKGIKSPDNEALPLIHTLHAYAHQHGEISMFREKASDDVLRAALRALAREMYAEWLAKQGEQIQEPARKPKGKKPRKTGRKIQSPGFDKTKTVKLRTREVVERKPKRAA